MVSVYERTKSTCYNEYLQDDITVNPYHSVGHITASKT